MAQTEVAGADGDAAEQHGGPDAKDDSDLAGGGELPLLAGTAQAAPPKWQVCTMMLLGVAGHKPYFRACRPLPTACTATPACACLARHGEPNFRYRCVRQGHRFIRGSVGLP